MCSRSSPYTGRPPSCIGRLLPALAVGFLQFGEAAIPWDVLILAKFDYIVTDALLRDEAKPGYGQAILVLAATW